MSTNPTGALRRIMAQFGIAFTIVLGTVWFLAIQLLSLIGLLIPVILVLIWSAGFIIWNE